MKQWTFIDKSKWPERGPWDNEPDKVQWQDKATGLTCLAVRADSHWCGYVGVEEGHQAFNQKYDDVNVEVHGGLTFSDFCQPIHERPEGYSQDPEARVCHTPEIGQLDRLWWLGFDCAHSGDKRPATCEAIHQINLKFPDIQGMYRTLEYVKAECEFLAKQLAEYK